MLYQLDEDYVDISPPVGHYQSPVELVEQINANMIKHERKIDSVRFSYNQISKKISVKFTLEERYASSLKMTKEMGELLGLEKKALPESISLSNVEPFSKLLENTNGTIKLFPFYNEEIYEGNGVCDLQRGFYSLFVYCDIVEQTVVSDVKILLLRTVNISGNEGLTVSRIYQTLQYTPVQCKQFETIEIYIRDNTGRKVPFQCGKVICNTSFSFAKTCLLLK